VPVAQVEGAEVRTIEGLGGDHPLQHHFMNEVGAQCGICTPGMVMAAVDLIERKPDASLAEIREGLAGNLCRCTGYVRIFESVVAAMHATRVGPTFRSGGGSQG
jgi:carbon-monoxide dehydrogenase small subunit